MFSRRATGKAMLVVDVDDISVGISIVEISSTGPATIRSAERRVLSLEERTKEQSIASLKQLLAESVAAVLKTYAGPPIRGVYAVLAAPWTRFRTVTAEEKFDARVITKVTIANLVYKALEGASTLDSTRILETGVMRVMLNGYPTGNPIGKHATRCSVIAFQSDVDADMRKVVSEVVGNLLPGRTIQIKSSMRAMLTVLHEIVPDINRYLIISIGGSATSCTVMRRDSVTQVAEVKEGKTTILKRISGAGLQEEVITQLRMLATDTCTTDACNALKDSIARTEPELASMYGAAFTALAATRKLPNTIILTAPAELTPWLHTFFARIDFSPFTATMQPFTIESLSAEHMSSLLVASGARADTTLSVAASYVNILEQAS